VPAIASLSKLSTRRESDQRCGFADPAHTC
jgi:hypothetical protein